jgi:transcriptional antiterminator NusG
MIMQSNWYALFVKSRHEFTVSGELQRKNVETFLPSIINSEPVERQEKTHRDSAFPGGSLCLYRSDPEKFVRVVKTRGTVSLIALEPGHPSPVDPAEIHALKILLESGERIDIHPHLKPGARVRVKRGVFKGASGVLARKDDHHILLVRASQEKRGR